MTKNLTNLIDSISNCLAIEKSYNLPKVCLKYGLDDGDEGEAFGNKFKYVRRRIFEKNEQDILKLAKDLINNYKSYSIGNALNEYTDGKYTKLSEITRRNLVERLLEYPNLEGKLTPEQVLEKSDLSNFVQSEPEPLSIFFDQAITEKNPLEEFLKSEVFYKLLDIQIFTFVETLVHPTVRNVNEQTNLIALINTVINVDNFNLEIYKEISNRYIYKVSSINGVKGKIKNLIFASNGYKPDIIIKDALNNDLEIVSDKHAVLIFDEPIPRNGLKWIDLVKWWSKINNKERSIDLARDLKNRLLESLGSEPEKDFFNLYYSRYAKKIGKDLPALIPQVYLHYDPYTLKKHGINYLLRQRMDFLILFSNSCRVVIEIDGKQHYADDNIASPEKYSEMVKLDRELKFLNYHVYRLGGHELTYNTESTIITFLDSLFDKYLLNFS